MSAKRTAPFSVDEKTHEVIQNNPDTTKLKEGEAPSARTIVKVKKDEPDSKEPQQPAEKKDEQKVKLFQGLFNNNGVGLFNNSSNLFGQPLGSKPEFKINFSSPNLFNGNGKTQTSTLFGSNNTSGEGKSIFGFSGGSLPPVKAGDESLIRVGDEDDDGDSAELERKQNMPIDKSKSSGNYEYKEEMKVVFNNHAKKYKRNNGDLVESVEVLVQVKEETGVALLVVRLPATKHPIFTGLLMPGSEVRVLNNKQENLEIAAFAVEHDKKPVRDKLKLQFETAEVGKNFQEAVNSYISKEAKASESKKEAEGDKGNDVHSQNQGEAVKKQ